VSRGAVGRGTASETVDRAGGGDEGGVAGEGEFAFGAWKGCEQGGCGGDAGAGWV